MTIALELPQTTDLLDPTAKLSSGFIKSLPVPVGLWCPSKLRNAAADFNPLKKNFGTLNGGITTVPGGFGTLGTNWSLSSPFGAISIPDAAQFQQPYVFTIGAFCVPSVVDTSFHFIVGKHTPGATSPDGSFKLYITNSGKLGLYNGAASEFAVIGTTTLIAGRAYFALAVSTGSQVYLFLNGQIEASAAYSKSFGAASGQPLVIGTNSTTGGNVSTNQAFLGAIETGLFFTAPLTAAQVSALYNCLRYGKPFPLFEPDTLYIDEPQTSTTLNLTSKSFVFSSSNSQASIQRNINAQSDLLSDSQGNITFTRDLKSTLDSRSFSSSATSVLRPLDSKLISQSESSAEETRQILSSSIIISQSFSSGKFALSAFINLESTAFAESFSYVEINLSRVLNSTGFVLSDLLAEITVKRNLSSIGLSLSDSISQETILRPLASEVFSEAKDHAEISIERLLTSEILSLSLAKGQFTTQLYTKFEVLSYRRYSSQYFVQSGSVNDSGQ